MALQLQPMAFPSCHSVVPPSKRLRSSSKAFMTSSTHSLAALEMEKKEAYRYHPVKEVVEFRETHSMPAEKMEIFKSLETWMADDILSHLKEVEKSWQPHDFLPTSESKEIFLKEVKELRESCKEIPDEYFLLVAVSMVTEEALPTYLTILNTLDGTRDETGACLSPWAIWARAWTAEENRHGDLLNKYLYLSGRVDMRQIEKSIQYLIGAGMDTKWENNPYKGFIYTTFQERATAMFHGRTGGLVKAHGDIKLAQICGTIAADEKRHEAAYTKIVEKLFQIDPDETMLALEDMMRKNITMPTQFVYDGMDDNLFRHVSAVAQRLGVYTAKDYADNMEFLIRGWKVDKLTGLSGDAQRAQEYVCELPPKIRKLEERAQEKAMRGSSTVPFSWIFGKQVRVL